MQALAVVGFVVVEFSLVLIPFLFLTIRPEATERAIRRFEDWLVGHARQLLAAVVLLVGGYVVLGGALRLLG